MLLAASWEQDLDCGYAAIAAGAILPERIHAAQHCSAGAALHDLRHTQFREPDRV